MEVFFRKKQAKNLVTRQKIFYNENSTQQFQLLIIQKWTKQYVSKMYFQNFPLHKIILHLQENMTVNQTWGHNNSYNLATSGPKTHF